MSGRFFHSQLLALSSLLLKAFSSNFQYQLNLISDPSIPGLVTIVLNTYFIDMMMSWLRILPFTCFRLECAKINRIESDNYPQ